MKNDLISREALKEDLKQYFSDGTLDSVSAKLAFNMILSKIDNAPTVELDEGIIQEVLSKRCMTVITNEYLIALLHGKIPQGEWDYEQVAFYGICSNCGVAVTSNLADIFLYEEIGKFPYNTNFCPNCGADMRKSGADNDV